MLTRKTILQAKIELNYGEAPVMVASDSVLIANLDFSVDPTVLEREVYQDSISNFGTRVGKKIYSCTFDVELKGRGVVPSVANPIEQDALIRACAMIVSDNAVSGRDYIPTSDELRMESISLKFNLDGEQFLMEGAYGNMAYNLVAGNFGIISFSFTGLYNKPTDVAQIDPTYVNDTEPPIVESLAFTIDNYGGIAETLAFDFNNEVSERPDLNSAEGLYGFRITNRDVKGTVDPEMVLLSVHDFWETFEDSTKVAIVAQIGSVVGNQFGLSMPAIQITGIGIGDRNGLRVYNLEYSATGDDDECILRAW